MPKPVPVMHVVAGPPGAGKSSTFPVKDTGLDFFDADARAAELNGRSYRRIPAAVRSEVNREFEAFVERHVVGRESFAFETTLRSTITFDQARRARQNGFFLTMTYVALSSVDLHVERVAARADQGGHSAPSSRIREIHALSLANLGRALAEFDYVAVYDNSDSHPELALVCHRGRVTFVSENSPGWVRAAVASSGLH